MKVNMVVLSVISVMLCGALFPCIGADDTKNDSYPRITVRGEGHCEVPVDFVEICFEMVFKDKNGPLKLKLESDKAVNRLVEILKKLGIKKKDIEVSFQELNSEGFDFDGDEKNSLASARSIVIKLRNLKMIDDVLKAILQMKAIKSFDLYYCSKDQSGADESALKMAVEDARKEAEKIAKVLNLKVGKILKVTFKMSDFDEGFYFENDRNQTREMIKQRGSYFTKTVCFTRFIIITYELNRK